MSRRTLLAAAGVSAGVALIGADLVSPLSASALVPAANGYVYPTDPFTMSTSAGGQYLAPRPGGRLHRGIDTWGHRGMPIYAIAGGRIVGGDWSTTSGDGHGWGYHVVVDHENGVVSRYAHFDGAPIKENGARVNKGEQIGRMGDSQYGPTSGLGVHLHLEIKVNGEYVNPLTFLQGGNTPQPQQPEDPLPVYHRRQGSFTTPIGTSANTRLYFESGNFDMAAGAGGPGLYQITTHASFTGLTPAKVLILQYFLLDAATSDYSGGFSATFPGVTGGNASIEFSTVIPVPSGNHLFVAARSPQGGVNQTSVAKMSLNYTDLA